MKEGHKKAGIIAASFTVVEVLNHAFDFIMYPLVIGFLGPWKGGAIMTILALVMNYGLVVFYNKTNRDWFGFEWLRLQKQEEAKSGSGRILRHILHFGHWPAYVFHLKPLSLCEGARQWERSLTNKTGLGFSVQISSAISYGY